MFSMRWLYAGLFPIFNRYIITNKFIKINSIIKKYQSLENTELSKFLSFIESIVNFNSVLLNQ